jgi:hypothetical protein
MDRNKDNLEMKYLKIFETFEKNDTLYVFDFDDTLVNTPQFEDFAIEYLKEEITVKEIVDKSVKTIGVNKSDLKWQDGRIYVEDPEQKIDVKENWVRKGARVYLMSPDIFGTTDLSLPTETLELVEFYNSVENKCILTARSEIVRDKIIESMKELGIEYPKYGLHMYPYSNYNRAGTWKGTKIVELVEKTAFKKVIFYDDNIKYLKSASKVIKEKLPNLDYKYVKV